MVHNAFISFIFVAEISYTFLTYQCLQKGTRDFSILFISWVIGKPGFCEWLETRSFLFWHKTQDVNRIKISRTLFIDIGKQETCAQFQQKLLNSVVVGAYHIFQFFRQNTLFRKNNRAFCIGFCNIKLVLPN